MDKTSEEQGSPVVEVLGALGNLEFKPGDRFVLMLRNRISSSQAEAILAMWSRFVGPDVPLLILDDDAQLAKVSGLPEHVAT